MLIVIKELKNGVGRRRKVNLEDETLIKKFLDLFMNPDVQETEIYIYEEGEIYYSIEYYFENAFKQIKFSPPDLPEDRLFLLRVLSL